MKNQLLLYCFSLGIGCLGWGQPWSYDFGTTSGSFSTASGTSTSFLPTPLSGTTFVRIGTGGGSINLDNQGLPAIGSGSELRLVAPTGTSINKSSLVNYTAGKSFYFKCHMLLGDVWGSPANSGTFYLVIGDGNTFSNATSFSGSETFTGIKWVFSGSGGISASYRNGGVWSALGTTPFSQENRYVLEIMGNNSTAEINYTYNGISGGVAPNKQDIYVNGVLVGNDLSKAQIINDANIDSWMFYGESSTGNAANLFADDIIYSNSIDAAYLGNTHYYSKSTGTLDMVTSWTTNQDGSGTLNPVSFITGYSTFNVVNNPGPTIGSDWLVIGTGSKISIGDGVNACSFLALNSIITENLGINSNACLTLAPGKNLTINGSTTLNGTECLVLQSNPSGTGSFIDHGISGSGTVKIERYIPAYTPGANPADGWHFLASPVHGEVPVPSSVQPGPNDDLYRWKESQNQWLNYKANAFNFENDQGYLCAYEASGVKCFSGMVNNANDTVTDRSLSGSVEDGYGWHLYPNPFPCAILWDNTGWGAMGFSSTASAKIWNSGNTYSDITHGNPIPAMNAFFLQVSNGTNRIIIPIEARSHSTQGWYKKTENPMMMLILNSTDNHSYTESIISFDENASDGFDEQYDSPFLAGSDGAPQLFSILPENTALSLNTLPPLVDQRIVPLGFIAGSSVGYSITIGKLENFQNNVSIVLEDNKEGRFLDLRKNPVYHFTSAPDDDPGRFRLHFDASTGIYQNEKEPFARIYTQANSICITSNTNLPIRGRVFVYHLTGKEITAQNLRENAMTKITLPGYSGFFLVRIIGAGKTFTSKVFLE